MPARDGRWCFHARMPNASRILLSTACTGGGSGVQPISGGSGTGAPVAAPGCRITAGQQATGVPLVPQPARSGEIAGFAEQCCVLSVLVGTLVGHMRVACIAIGKQRHTYIRAPSAVANPSLRFGKVASYVCQAGHSSVPTQAYNKPQPTQPASQPAPGGQAGSSTGSGTSSSPFAAASTQENAPARPGSRAGMNGWKDQG